MAVLDDLKRLEQEDVVYLTWVGAGAGGSPIQSPPDVSASFTYSGRLHQSSSGSWIFKTFVAGNRGLVGIDLGVPVDPSWSSSQDPTAGIEIVINYPPSVPSSTSVPDRFEQVFITQVLSTDMLT
jgi:hypothetical protein